MGCRGDSLVSRSDHLRDARVRVMRLCARQHDLLGMQATRDPECFEVRDRARRRQVREMRFLVQHPCDLIDGLALEVCGGWAAIEGVVI